MLYFLLDLHQIVLLCPREIKCFKKATRGHFSLIWKAVYQLCSHGIWVPQKSSEKKRKKKTRKKTCELNVYLCILESVISSEFSRYFKQRFNKNLLKVHPCKVRMNVKNIERESMTHF